MSVRTQQAPALPRADDTELVRTGLSADQVAVRRERGLTNAQPTTTSRSVWAIIRTHLLTLFNLILGLCAAEIGRAHV